MRNERYKGKNVIWESKTKQVFIILVSFLFTFIALWIRDTDKLQFWLSIFLFGFGGIFMLVRFLNPKNIFVTPKSKIGKEILAERTELHQNDNGIFEYHKNGFIITTENETYNYEWNEIKTVYGYKIDLLAYDEICIDVFTIDQKKFTITESTGGWFQFISRLSENIKSIEIDWYLKIANPPFEKNLTLLYDKQNRTIEQIRTENVTA
ncbi:hypothetical protein [Flavobacterium pectinovorum]|uniref:hypothetical protein n=1 Tax=Flavobacterium pectinovorum TaxID=29533 RepID=UPI001FAC5B2E|nr:hypothetical protein [Flavobacterium pectinovorum]MCI9844516.1 hypothetical protein [Flavobacterium pectinovorum]